MYAPTLAKSSAGYTKIGWAPGGDLTSLVQGSWQQVDDFYGQLSASQVMEAQAGVGRGTVW